MATLQPGPWREPPPLASVTTASWSSIYQDVGAWFDGFGFLFDEISDPETPGVFRDVLEAVRKDPEGPQIDIENEIIARLSPGIVKVHDYNAAKTTLNPNGYRALYELKARETDQLRAVFRRFFQNDDGVRVSEIGGQLMWNTTTAHSLIFDTGEEKAIAIKSLAVIDGAVLLCTDPMWLRSALSKDDPDKPLSKSPDFIAAKTFLFSRKSAEGSFRTFSRIDEEWRGPYRHLRKTNSDRENDLRIRLLEWLLCPTSDRRHEVFTQLPDWEIVGPALGSMVLSLRPADVGFEGIWGMIQPSLATPAQATPH